MPQGVEAHQGTEDDDLWVGDWVAEDSLAWTDVIKLPSQYPVERLCELEDADHPVFAPNELEETDLDVRRSLHLPVARHYAPLHFLREKPGRTSPSKTMAFQEPHGTHQRASGTFVHPRPRPFW